MTRWIDGLAALSDRYDGFILDVWGVIHDGVRPYPQVVATLERLRQAGKRLALLSNAPTRASAVTGRIVSLGVPADLLPSVMSSGEEVWQSLAHRPDAFYRALGRRCLWLGPERHTILVRGLDLDFVSSPAEADFLLNAGPDDLDDDATVLLPVLVEAARRGLPMVCANPDLHVMMGGDMIVCAGRVAQIYEQMGGTVRWHGKPFASVYDATLGLLGTLSRERVLAIGDSLRTDIAGATAAGLDSLLLAGGIHADVFGFDATATADPAALLARLPADCPQPTFLSGRLTW